ncbi:MAG TPA: hypothetical protein VGM90_09310 [Kofleriaceae bacterium]|jgi:tetratricopeptide (TPR) repeat protein
MLSRLRNDPALLALLCALVAVIILYAPTLSYGIVDYDDGYLIRDNWVVRDASWASVHTIFFDLDSPRRFVLSPEYLPIRDLSVMLDCALWGDSYAGFHATNLVLYLAAIIVWFDVLVRFGVPRTVAAVAMVLWALHPSHAESVAWLAERKGLLGMMFAGVCGACYTRYRDGRTLWLVFAMIASVCAVWSKAHAAFAVAALAGLELVRAPAGRERRRALVGIGAIGVCAAVAFIPVLRMAASSQVVGLASHAPAGRGALVLGVHGLYVELAAMLRSNAVAYPLSTDGPSVVEIIVGAVGLAAVVLALVAPRGRSWSPSPIVRSGAVLWFVGWFPVSHLALSLQMIFVADRYLLIPSLGFCLALSALVMSIRSVRARRALVVAIAIGAAMRTLDARSSWRDGESLWARAVESNPADGEAWSAYAEAVARSGDAERAEKIVVDGLAHVRTGRLLMRGALLRIAHGDSEGGLAMMRDASDAGEARAMANLALLLLPTDPSSALTWARRAAQLMPMYAPARRAAGKVELATGHAAAAEPEFRRAHELEPSCTNAYNLALALLEMKRTDEAHALLVPCRGDRVVGAQVEAALHR